MKLSEKFEEALIYATRAHGNQTRKKTGIPFVAHILGVTAIALEYGANESEAIGGIEIGRICLIGPIGPIMSNHTIRYTLLAGCCLAGFAAASLAGDWIHWRGPEQNGVSREVGLPDNWTLDVNDPNSNLIWKAPYGCRSTPLVMGGSVFIINSDGDGIKEGERVMAFDAATGKVLWEHKFNVWHTDIVSSRVGWSKH